MLVVTLLARNRRHYLIEVEDKEKEVMHNVDNHHHEEMNDDYGKSVKPIKVK